MIDHRALQRALFRVQLDAALHQRVVAREPAALEWLGLAAAELDLLLAADPIAVRADRGQQRRAQLVGNLTTEFGRSVWAADVDPQAFVESEPFHRAIARDEPLPLAFGAWLETQASAPPARALVALERTMAHARRELRPGPAVGPDELALAPTCHLLSVPSGTHDLAVAVGVALAAGRAPEATPLDEARSELLLVQAGEPEPSGRRDVRVEPLEPAVARLLQRARAPLGPRDRAAFAASEGAAPDELEGFARSLVEDGVLIAGPTSATPVEPPNAAG